MWRGFCTLSALPLFSLPSQIHEGHCDGRTDGKFLRSVTRLPLPSGQPCCWDPVFWDYLVGATLSHQLWSLLFSLFIQVLQKNLDRKPKRARLPLCQFPTHHCKYRLSPSFHTHYVLNHIIYFLNHSLSRGPHFIIFLSFTMLYQPIISTAMCRRAGRRPRLSTLRLRPGRQRGRY